MKNFRELKFKEIDREDYEGLCNGKDVPLTQNSFYGEWHVGLGKSLWRYLIEKDEEVVGLLQVIKYPLSFGKNYLYIPHGPVFTQEVSGELLSEFKKFCYDLLKKENSIFLRFDPIWELNSQVQVTQVNMDESFFKAPKFLYDGSFQPKYEWIIDLSLGEEQILSSMKKVNRYTIKQAEKNSFEVIILDKNFLEYLDKFYELINMTAKRDSFAHYSKEYYGEIFSQCENSKNGLLLLVRMGGKVILINFFVIYGSTAFYLFSASHNQHRRLGYTYLAQWEAIKYFKGLRLKRYNLGAVLLNDNEYPFYKKWQGFSDFKKRFGGSLIGYADFYDVVYSKSWYFLYLFKRFVLSYLTAIFDF